MSTSELIVCLWFLPVILVIVIPLTLLCAWETYRVVKKITALFGKKKMSDSFSSGHYRGHAA